MDIQSCPAYANVEFPDTFCLLAPSRDGVEDSSTVKMTLRRTARPESGPQPEEFHAAWLVIRIAMKYYYGAFYNRKWVTDSMLDRLGASVKRQIVWTHQNRQHREYLANSADLWSIFTDVFNLGTRVLRIQSFPNAPSYDEHGCSFSNFMVSNHPTLIKDIERLNDLLALCRNLLTTRKVYQEAAAAAKFDQQVLQVVDACIRVTARGYDGEQVSATEQKWGNIIAAYKKLTMTALQWLYVFVLSNERRKLHLFNQLFGDFHVPSDSEPSSPDQRPEDDDATDTLAEQLPLSLNDFDANTFQEASALKVMDEIIRSVQGYCQQTMRPLPDYPQDFPQKPYGDFLVSVLQSLNDKRANSTDQDNAPDFSLLPTSYFEQIRNQGIQIEAVEVAGPEQAAQEIQEAKEKVLSEFLYQMAETDRIGGYDARSQPENLLSAQLPSTPIPSRMAYPTPPTQNAPAGQMLELEEDDDEEDAEEEYDQDEEEDEGDEEEEDDVDEDSEDEVGSASRGLLTDIPLVLGPSEIDALPMMILSAIRRNSNPKDTPENIHVMQALRCYRMINESAGRNLLRELLIFIAAWDLQEHEPYFQLMMSIMETILSYGLMPFAFDSFSEDKDVVSPAQSILIKLLTQMFRRRQAVGDNGAAAVAAEATTAAAVNLELRPSSQFPAPPAVETTIVRYIFTVFRTHIIPQTCALIYLQGQIRMGKVLPEEFPLNLWDMERVYEGVYQFLEFFAVLTESDTWKALLVKEEIVFELITLLRELDLSIPKSSEVHAPASPAAESTDAVPQRQEQAPPSQPTTTAPVAVERPYDPIPPPPLSPADTFSPSIGNNPNIPSNNPNLPADNINPGLPPDHPASDTASALLENNIEPADFEWRNLKKLVVLVLSSLVWRSPTVQDQIRKYGGVEMILNCCNADGNNPYIKDHAVMCLRFLLEGSRENQRIVRELEERRAEMVARNAERDGTGAGAGGTGAAVVEADAPGSSTQHGGRKTAGKARRPANDGSPVDERLGRMALNDKDER